MGIKIDISQLPELPEPHWEIQRWQLSLSHLAESATDFKNFCRDGVMLHGEIKIKFPKILPPTFNIVVNGNQRSLLLVPNVETFILRYLSTGKHTEFPLYFENGGNPNFIAELDYIYKHIKRENSRNSIIFHEEEKDGVKGIRPIAYYPYGSVNYGFLPHSIEELNDILDKTEPYKYEGLDEYDIPELQNSDLDVEELVLEPDSKLDSVLDEIPTNCIINKTICGCGATWLEIHAKRNSIIIEPNVPVIIGKKQQHPNIIAVHGKSMSNEDIARQIKGCTGYVKIMTTPDSFPKILKAFQSLRINYIEDYFLLFDECEKIVSDVDFRHNMTLPIDDFFRFKNKTMVSATPIVINDPRFKQQGFKIIKIVPKFDYKLPLELKPTNNVSLLIKRTLESIDKKYSVCIFYNSIQGINEIIDLLPIGEEINIYCSTSASKELKRNGDTSYDSVTDKDGKTNLRRFNFFTSRFYSAVDIVLDYKPIVIMITDVYKKQADKMPYSLIEPQTEAIQIAGRFRNGIARLIHITNTNPKMDFLDKDEVKQFLDEQHEGYLKLRGLEKQAKTRGEKHIISQAIDKNDYVADGYVMPNGNVNHFRYNNAYLDERLKMLYRYPAVLHKAYIQSQAFVVLSESEYAAYTDEERRKLKYRNTLKEERIKLLYKIVQRVADTNNIYDLQFLEELRAEYGLYLEAFAVISYRRIKQLEFKDSAIKKEIEQAKFETSAKSDKVVQAVYKIFNPDTRYKTAFIKQALAPIFDANSMTYDKRRVAQYIEIYFIAKQGKTGKGYYWDLGQKKL